uniref:Alanine--glyoxylate aminotransferase n=1 Tax=Dermatophagoides pteronyssinus TaxID=6956 RepID=A0A6P6YHB9_DERPT|nr:serine--pyruvate aminotransferase, mitochondrial-like [Dermatophagoides pteronyssinus]
MNLMKSEPDHRLMIKTFQEDFMPHEKLLMIPGPTNLNPNVLQSLSKPLLSHTDPQFYELLDQIQNGIRYLFQTNNPYTFAITGSATIAMETAICNLLLPGQTLLSLVHGYWGNRVATMGSRLGYNTNIIQNNKFGENFTLIQIENALRKYRPSVMYVCHGDSSLGCVQNLNGIGKLCHRYNCLLIVDAVVSLCTTQLEMDNMEIDVLFSGCQKALSGPPGISLISFSDKAVQIIKSRSNMCPISSFYMDINLVAKAWGLDNNNVHTYHYTPAINLLYGIHTAIREIINEDLSKVIERHQKAKHYLEKQIQNIGLKLLIQESENRLAGITSVLIPDDIDGNMLIQFMYTKHDILIGGSLLASDPNVPKFWRIGYLGVNADRKKINQTIESLQDALQQQRNKFKAHL